MPDSLRPHGLLPTRLLCPWDFPGKNTGVRCHSLLQGIFMTQGSNLGLLHCRQILYWLSFQGSPWELFVLIYETTSKVRVVPVVFFCSQDISAKTVCFYYWGLKRQKIESIVQRELKIKSKIQIKSASETSWKPPTNDSRLCYQEISDSSCTQNAISN